MTFICKLGAPVIPRCQQVLAEKRILMKYLLLAGRSIITYYYTVLFSTKGVNSSFNVACSPLTNLFKKGAAKELLCFFSLPAAAGRRREQRRRLWQDLMRCQRGHGGKFRLQKRELRT